jgi:hypothetical protein
VRLEAGELTIRITGTPLKRLDRAMIRRDLIAQKRFATVMKRTIVMYALICTAACTTLVYDARYDVSLSEVGRRDGAGEVKKFVHLHGHSFEDEYIRVTWTPFETQLGLILVNKTDSTQLVLWDQVSYQGTDGKPERVIHEGVDATNPVASMPPTAVAPGATLLELLEPRSHLPAATVERRRYDAPLIGVTNGTSEGEVRSRMVRGTIKVLLPIAANGTTREYFFDFSVNGTVVLAGWAS